MQKRLWRNATVYTMNLEQPRVEAVLTIGDRIAAAGAGNDLKDAAGSGVEEIDLGGATLLPGFIEAHNHMISFGLTLGEVDARHPTVTSIAEIAAAIGARAASQPPGTWVLARGYDDNKLAERRHPTRQDLDRAAPYHPVLLTNGSGHMSVANSLALRKAGIDATTPDPQGGQVVRSEDGSPTGLLLETAQRFVQDVIPPPTTHDLLDALRRCAHAYAAAGITSSTTAGVNTQDEFIAHQRFAREDEVPLRTTIMIGKPLYPLARDLGLRTGLGDDRLRVGPLKLFSDGSLIGRTAAVTIPFAHDPRPDNLGMTMMPAEELDAIVAEAHDAGFQVAIHAIGDRAIDMVLTAYERAQQRNPRPDARHRIEHCGILRPDLIQRLRAEKVLAISQPIFITEYGDGFIRHLGRERAQLAYPFRTLLDAGVHLVFSSDCPVSAFEPLKSMEVSVTEVTGAGTPYAPPEAITVDEALRCYTVNGAYATYDEHRTGSIAPGKLADFAILARDPHNDRPEEIASNPVVGTVIGGELIYQQALEHSA